MPWFLDRQSHVEFLASSHARNQGGIHTKWDFEFRREPNRLADLDYAIRSRITQESLEMEDENGRKCLDEHLLAPLADASWTELYRS
jgi:hypothetical protein